MASTVSFRITRNTEDLAQTIHLLSQRLVKLEQRLAAMELQIERHQDPDPTDLTRLDHVDVLLEECRQLLDIAPTDTDSDNDVNVNVNIDSTGDAPRQTTSTKKDSQVA